MKKKKICIVLVFVIFLLLVAGSLIILRHSKNDFQYWTSDSKSLSALRDYVKDVTRQGSENFIPVEDRIAVFDMDGTLYCEKAPTYVEWWMFVYRVLENPSYEASPELVSVANAIMEATEKGIISDDLEKKQ